ncbi:MAG: alcohol dehydrogenase catalytic domain-containing protein [Hyphomicrobiales bacterium]|nr:alcohol dehydrogenase catalytic domain-containing protein [Hyphomicrobiales bacterium]
MEMMKAAVLVAPRQFDVRELPIPQVGADDALIAVERCGICGTDIHMFNGHYASERLPLTPGHELAGTIARLGRNVTHLAIGSRAVVDINIGCGQCYYCRRNEILNCLQMQQVGITRDGAFAQFVCAPARLVIPVPDNCAFGTLALTEPVACVARAARKANITFGQSVVVLGAGPIGNLHVQMLRLIGAAPIIVLETSEARAQLAREVGADVVVTDPARIRDVVRSQTDGRGADVVIESVGKMELYALAFEMIRPGGHIAAFGITGPEADLALPILETVLREKSIKGSVAGMGEDMHDALTLLRHDRFKLEAFTSKTYPLEDIQRAFDELSTDPRVLKVQIVP